MSSVIRSRIIKIGNSQGVRIPKLMLEQAQLGEEVELELGHEVITIRAVQHARHGWDQAFQAMAERGDDQLSDFQLDVTTWDEEEWEW